MGTRAVIWLLMGSSLIPPTSLSYLRFDWPLHNQHSYVSCHVLFDSKSVDAFKYPIPCSTPLYVLLSPSGQSSKYSAIRCKESF